MYIENCNYLIYMKYLFNEFIFKIMITEQFHKGQINCLERLQSCKKYSFNVLPFSPKSYIHRPTQWRSNRVDEGDRSLKSTPNLRQNHLTAIAFPPIPLRISKLKKQYNYTQGTYFNTYQCNNCRY